MVQKNYVMVQEECLGNLHFCTKNISTRWVISFLIKLRTTQSLVSPFSHLHKRRDLPFFLLGYIYASFPDVEVRCIYPIPNTKSRKENKWFKNRFVGSWFYSRLELFGHVHNHLRLTRSSFPGFTIYCFVRRSEFQ